MNLVTECQRHKARTEAGPARRHDTTYVSWCVSGVSDPLKVKNLVSEVARVTGVPLALLFCIEPPARSHGPEGSLTSSLLYFLFVKMPLQMIRWVVFGEKWWTGP